MKTKASSFSGNYMMWIVGVMILALLFTYRWEGLRERCTPDEMTGFLTNASWIAMIFAAGIRGKAYFRFDLTACFASAMICLAQMLTHYMLRYSLGYTVRQFLQQFFFYYLLFMAAGEFVLNQQVNLAGERKKVSPVTLIVTAALLLLVLLAQYAAIDRSEISADSINQWQQIHGELRYNTIHAIGHTLFLKALFCLYDGFEIAVLVQFVGVTAVYLCFFSYFYRKGFSAPLLTMLFLAAMMIVPESGGEAFFRPWKDTPAAVCLCFVTYILMKYREEGKISCRMAFVLGALLAWCYLFRLNGIVLLLVCGSYFAVSFFRRRYYRQLCLMLTASVACVLLVNVYSEKVLQPIEQENGYSIQVFGSGIAAMVNSGELTEEELAQVESLLPVDWMRERYRRIGKEALIWSSDGSERIAADPELAIFNNEFVLALGAHRNDVIRLYFRLMPRHFVVCAKDVFSSLRVMWMTSQSYLFCYFFQFVLLLYLAVRAKMRWEEYLVFLPALCNTVSIMISTITSESRYLLPNFMLLPVYLLYLAWKNMDREKC